MPGEVRVSLAKDGQMIDPEILGIMDADGEASEHAWEITFSDLRAQLEPVLVERGCLDARGPDSRLCLCPAAAVPQAAFL